LLSFCSLTSFSQNEKTGTNQSHIKFALNAFSFNDVLMPKGTSEKPAFTLFDLLDWCASQNVEALDITAYYIPTYPEVPSDEYIYELKRKAFVPVETLKLVGKVKPYDPYILVPQIMKELQAAKDEVYN